MSKLKRVLKNRILITIFAVTVGWGSLTVAMAPPAYACPPCDVEYHYFTDSTYTVECGIKIIFSSGCGQAYKSGCETPYYQIEHICL
ncbi:MAG TPA: hypothetical protein VE262_22495 [Blastocatellia bacterium]|nr:hypothetical protein [Blastocatellia bacterium]